MEEKKSKYRQNTLTTNNGPLRLANQDTRHLIILNNKINGGGSYNPGPWLPKAGNYKCIDDPLSQKSRQHLEIGCSPAGWCLPCMCEARGSVFSVAR